MTLSTGHRKFHFKQTHPTDPDLKPFAEWSPATQKFSPSSASGFRKVGTVKVRSINTASA